MHIIRITSHFFDSKILTGQTLLQNPGVTSSSPGKTASGGGSSTLDEADRHNGLLQHKG